MTVRMRDRVPNNLTLPPDLIAEVDAVAGARGRSRFIEEATRAALRREQLRAMHRAVAGALREEDHPAWSTSDAVVTWVRESRSASSRASALSVGDGAGPIVPVHRNRQSSGSNRAVKWRRAGGSDTMR